MQRSSLKLLVQATRRCHHEIRSVNPMRSLRTNSSAPVAFRKMLQGPKHRNGLMNVKLLSNKASSNVDKKPKTAGDVFLDNLGTIFLSVIALIILALVRSSKATTAKTTLRTLIENQTVLDPFEIDDLRKANPEFDEKLFNQLLDRLLSGEISFDPNDITYKEFIDHVMQILKSMKGDEFTIKFGHLLDRVVIAASEHSARIKHGGNIDGDEKSSDISFFLVVLSLALNSPIRDRVDILFQIMSRFNGTNNEGFKSDVKGNKTVVTETDVIKMIDFLQQTCQLVPETQILESETKYPVQEYKVGSPSELMAVGKISKMEQLSDDALKEGASTERKLNCDDFHHLLRSKGVCAWGECYVRKKVLD